jgi:HK97 family phage major capsid protein
VSVIRDFATFRTADEVVAYDKELKSRIDELEAEFGVQRFSDEAREEYAAIREAREEVAAWQVEYAERQAYAEKQANAGKIEGPGKFTAPNIAKSRLPEDLTDLSEYRARTNSEEAMIALMRDGARKLSEAATYPHPRATEEGTVAHIHKLLATHDNGEEGVPAGSLARRVLVTGSEVYGRAFGKYISGQPLTPTEQAAINTVGTTTAGGYAVPYQLDPTVVLTSDGATNPLRAISRVEQLAGNTWKGVTSTGFTVTRGPAESTAVDPKTLTLGQPEVTVQPVKAEVQFSIEAGEDWPRLQAEVARMFQDAKDSEEADSFVNGAGTTVYPGGISATLDPSSYVATADTSAPIALALADLFTLRGALPPRFRPNAKYLAADAIYGLIRQFAVGTVGDGSVWTYGITEGDPDRLLGKPAYESSAMDDDMTEGNLVVIYGDFQYFLIAEKIGMTVELDPHVRDTNGKWTGDRALLMHYRNSSVILADNAFRALNSGTIAS